MARFKTRLRASALVATILLGSHLPSIGAAAESCPRIEFGQFHQQPSSDTRPVESDRGQIINFGKTPIFQLTDIAQVRLGKGNTGVLITVKAAATERLETATTSRSGARLALVVDDTAVMVIVWEGDFGLVDGNIQFDFRAEGRAQELVSIISRCLNN